MNQPLSFIAEGNREASENLLPLVYQELRQLAAQRLRREPPGQTLQATALVHEAYLRLIQSDTTGGWDNRLHFFAAASEAMRRILVENARRKKRVRHGGEIRRVELEDWKFAIDSSIEEMLALDEAIEQLGKVDHQAAEMVKLRHFCGLTTEEAGDLLGIPERSSYRIWAFAKAWLYRSLHPGVCVEA